MIVNFTTTTSYIMSFFSDDENDEINTAFNVDNNAPILSNLVIPSKSSGSFNDQEEEEEEMVATKRQRFQEDKEKSLQLYNQNLNICGLDGETSMHTIQLKFEGEDRIEHFSISSHSELSIRNVLMDRLLKLYKRQTPTLINSTVSKLLNFDRKCHTGNGKELSVEERKFLIMKELLNCLTKIHKFYNASIMATFDAVQMNTKIPDHISVNGDYVNNNDIAFVAAVRFEKPAVFEKDGNKFSTNSESCIPLTVNNQVMSYFRAYLNKYVEQKNQELSCIAQYEASSGNTITIQKQHSSPAQVICKNIQSNRVNLPYVAGEIRFYLAQHVVRKVLDEEGKYSDYIGMDKEKMIPPKNEGIIIGDKIGFKTNKNQESNVLELRVYCRVVIIGGFKYPF